MHYSFTYGGFSSFLGPRNSYLHLQRRAFIIKGPSLQVTERGRSHLRIAFGASSGTSLPIEPFQASLWIPHPSGLGNSQARSGRAHPVLRGTCTSCTSGLTRYIPVARPFGAPSQNQLQRPNLFPTNLSNPLNYSHREFRPPLPLQTKRP
ncbi:MAG: hypothetical protein BMS9Abin11_1800 [Gammaproteobacteria bacterium]|nr:MAG: hypothetical protein BMS9Abin11_1800 [Gammaproteobacteria bacterium]